MKVSGSVAYSGRWLFVALLLVGIVPALQAKWLTIHNDFFQYDLDGNKVQTRSG